MEDYIAKAKEIWGNKQMRAAIILGVYFVFFVILLIIFMPSSRQVPLSDEEEATDVEDNNEVDLTPDKKEIFPSENYQYQLTIIDDTDEEYQVMVEVNDETTTDLVEAKEIVTTALLFNDVMLNRMVQNAELVTKKDDYLKEERQKSYLLDETTAREILLQEALEVELELYLVENELQKVQVLFYDAYEGITKLEKVYISEEEAN